MKKILFLSGLLAWCGAGLRAQTERMSLNADWQFARLDPETASAWTAGRQGADWSSQFNVQHVEGGAEASPLALTDSLLRAEQKRLPEAAGWQTVRLPHTAAVEPFVILKPWEGVCYYRRRLTLTKAQAEGRCWIEFEGAMQLCDVWVNGRHAMQHAGGFTTFVVDATGMLHAGENELTVRLDNRDNPLIPPGKPIGALDFCYHSGLYRDVTLICKPGLHITHPLLTDRPASGGHLVTYPEVSEQRARVKVRTEVANRSGADADAEVRQALYVWRDGRRRGRPVAETSTTESVPDGSEHTYTQELTVERPRLWSPDSPQLYVLRTEVRRAGRLVDSEETRIGIRRFELTREGCFVNGKRVELDGSNRHQEYPYVGNAVSDRAHYRDMRQIRENGFNTVRLGHYPQDPAVLEACDELGLLVIEPIPGWQYYNADTRFVDATMRDVQALIRRDRNHPCVLMWETTLNESWPPVEWKDLSVRTAHAEMPEGECFTAGDSYGYSGFDVCYNDWDGRSFGRPNKTQKPGFIREYYDYEFGGHYSSTRIGRGDGERALRQNLWNAQWSLNSNRTRSDGTTGGAVWSMYDYNRGCCNNVCLSGVADLFRRPKYSLFLYRTQQPAGSYTPAGRMPHELFVASRWDAQSTDTVTVLGNVAEVELRVNGTVIERRRPDNGPTTDYMPQPDGGNAEALAYPPFTFRGVAFRPGCLEAVGYDTDGREVARTAVHTPGEPARLRLTYFESGRPAGRHDVLIVYAEWTDNEGNPCHTNGLPVTLDVHRGGCIMGPSTTNTEDGTASFIVQTDDDAQLCVEARSNGQTATARWKLATE